MPIWIKEKLFYEKDLIRGIGTRLNILREANPALFPEHHLSHAASAFYPSSFADAAILTVDGVGEWATVSISKGQGKDITLLNNWISRIPWDYYIPLLLIIVVLP